MYFRILIIGLFFLSVASIPAPSLAADKPTIPSDFEIMMSQGPCYGSCPIYKLTIKNDGTVIFFGENFVETKGEAKGKLTQAQMGELLEEFQKTKFLSLKDIYHYEKEGCKKFATDHSTVTISVSMNQRKNTIRHDRGCHDNNKGIQALNKLEARIDEITNSKQWIKNKN